MTEIIQPNPIFLDPNGRLERLPEFPEAERPEEFWEGFDKYGLFYDVFRDANGTRVWMVGPKTQSFEGALESARVIGKQSGAKAKLKFLQSWTACIAYIDLPERDTSLTIQIDGQEIDCVIGKNLSAEFTDKRILFCINHNNDLGWIADWAKFYQKEHAANAVVIFDNKSDAYGTFELAETLENVDGLDRTLVVNWPFHFGVMDKVGQKLGSNGYVRFAQPVMYMCLYLRMAKLAKSIVNVDVDELVLSGKGRSLFKFVEKRIFGCVKFERFLVENVVDGSHHNALRFADFVYRKRANLGRQDKFKKWAMAPKRTWPRDKVALPNTHWIEGVWNPYPVAKDFKCYHFAGINTGWRAKTQKGERAEWQHKRHIAESYDPKKHVKDEFLAKKLNEIFGQ